MIKYYFSLLICLALFNNVLAQDLAPLFAKLDPSVVTIQTVQVNISSGTPTPSNALGSGIIIDETGLILTAAHVVETANAIGVKLSTDEIVEAEIVKTVPTADVALLKLKRVPPGLKVATLGNSDDLKVGNQVITIGSPFGVEHSLSVGYVSGKMKKGVVAGGEMVGYIQTDAAINQGNSGGAMFNLKGEVIGIVSFILSQGGGFDGIGFAIDINTTRKVLLENKDHFWTGFDGVFLGDDLSKILNVPQSNGVLIQRVTTNSFADQLGLQEGFFQAEILGQKLWLGGDIILAMQGTSCANPHNLDNIKHAIEHLKEGEPVTMKILRHGKIIELNRSIVAKK